MLSFVARDKRSNLSPQSALYTGFVVDVEGHWLWITAGHVITEVRKAIEAGYVIQFSRFLDTGMIGKVAFPAHFDLASTISVFEEPGNVGLFATGMDYAAFPLNELTRQNFIKGGGAPIPIASILPVGFSAESYYVVGVPHQGSQVNLSEDRASLAIVSYRLRRLEDDRRQGFLRLTFDTRDSEINVDGKPMRSLVGLSGGPVFGVQGDFEQYGLIGVQSSESKDKLTAFVCPVRPFLEALKGHIISGVFPFRTKLC